MDFIHQSLKVLKQQLEELGSSLLVLHGIPSEIFKVMNPRAVYTNHDYEPYARERDESVKKILEGKGIPFRTFKDQVIFDRDEIVKGDNTPYTVFTPYSRKWKSQLSEFYLRGYPTEKYFHRFAIVRPLPFPTLEEIGFKPTAALFPERVIPRVIISKYDTQRNFPSIHGTTRLSVHLRFGTVSIRKLAQVAVKTNDSWLNELIWREFYQMILWHFPHVETHAFKPAYETN